VSAAQPLEVGHDDHTNGITPVIRVNMPHSSSGAMNTLQGIDSVRPSLAARFNSSLSCNDTNKQKQALCHLQAGMQGACTLDIAPVHAL
jgi:hypothetical protein